MLYFCRVLYKLLTKQKNILKMKKIYTTIAMMFAVAFAFAQQPVPAQLEGKQVKKDVFGKEAIVTKHDLNRSASKEGPAAWWFSYANTMTASEEYDYPVMLQDSTALMIYSNGEGRPQMFSWAQTMDFTSAHWSSALFLPSMEYDIPDLGAPGNVYNIDSVAVSFVYWRIEGNTDVDTMVITVAAAAELGYNTFFSPAETTEGDTAWLFTTPLIDFDQADATIGLNQADMPFEYREVIKVPLTIADTSSNFAPIAYPLQNMQNITAQYVNVAISFKSGKANRTLNDTLGHTSDDYEGDMLNRGQINRFHHLVLQNAEDLSWGTPGAIEQTNTSLVAMEWSLDPESSFHNLYVPASVWIDENGSAAGYTPDVQILASCADCDNIGVTEFKNEIVVRPNPATNFFMVDLGANVESQVELYNLVGQRIYSQTTSDATVTVNTNNLESGVYMLRVTQNGAVHTSKVVIN